LVIILSLIALFIFRDNDLVAIRVSNLVSFIVLFWADYRWGSILVPARGASGCCSSAWAR
jgi:hypothetical protein